MNLEDQVCSLDLAKRLKELGVKQESIFWWDVIETVGKLVANTLSFLPVSHPSTEYYSAFTVAELGVVLPTINGCPFQLIKGETLIKGEIYCVRYDILEMDNFIFTDKNPANACAKMLIYLFENGLMKNE